MKSSLIYLNILNLLACYQMVLKSDKIKSNVKSYNPLPSFQPTPDLSTATPLRIATVRAYCELPGDIGARIRKYRIRRRPLSCAPFVVFSGATRSRPQPPVGDGVNLVVFSLSTTASAKSAFFEGSLGTPRRNPRHIFLQPPTIVLTTDGYSYNTLYRLPTLLVLPASPNQKTLKQDSLDIFGWWMSYCLKIKVLSLSHC